MLYEVTAAYQIREAKPEEAEELSALAFRSKQYWDYSDEFMENCRRELTYSPDELVRDFAYVIEKEGHISGFYVLTVLDDEQIELEALFVEPEYIGYGFGRELMNHARIQAYEAGFSVMIIQSDPYAENFYYSAGAVKIGRRQSDSICGRFLPLLKIDLNEPPHLTLAGADNFISFPSGGK